mgnify:CR=1 FL=1|jgi:hypothetical protein
MMRRLHHDQPKSFAYSPENPKRIETVTGGRSVPVLR